MAKLTKEQERLHREASRLVKLDRELTEEERETVLTHWQESSTTSNSLDGAFFTPEDLALELRLEVCGQRIIDLCAGIGRLAWALRDEWSRGWEKLPPRELVCVEKNPRYVEVGRKVVPEARWICADIFTLDPATLGRFDYAVANPPFGRVERTGNGPRYRGPNFEFHAIDVASTVARKGVFIVPQMSSPFKASGVPCYEEQHSTAYERFHRETGFTLCSRVGIDTSAYADGWRGVSPRTEVVFADFEDAEEGLLPVPAPRSVSTPRAAVPKPTAATYEYVEAALF
ncbi:methyltransferase [Streptomyces sp. NPDC004546]|uniref:methyltransferase n=1 Tax=Streptomyces sp. NPDC004546 TaxID=3154282 RepID=UPI0033B44788